MKTFRIYHFGFLILAAALAGCSSLPISFAADRAPDGGYAVGIRGTFVFSVTKCGGENTPPAGVLAPLTRDLGDRAEFQAFKGVLKAYLAGVSDGKTMGGVR